MRNRLLAGVAILQMAVLGHVSQALALDPPVTPLGPTTQTFNPADFSVSIDDQSVSPTNFVATPPASQGGPNAIISTNGTGDAGLVVPGVPFAASTITPSATAIVNTLGLVTVMSSVTWDFEIVAVPGAPSSFVPASTVTLDVGGMTSASGTGAFQSIAEFYLTDSPVVELGTFFYSCAYGNDVGEGTSNTCPGPNNPLTPPVTYGSVGTATYSQASGGFSFTFPTNKVQGVEVEAFVVTDDNNSSATAFVDPTITIDPSTPDYQYYQVIQSANLVPEPSSWAMLGSAGLIAFGLAGVRRVRLGGPRQSRQRRF